MSTDVPTEMQSETASSRSNRSAITLIAVVALGIGSLVALGFVPKLRAQADRRDAMSEARKPRAVTFAQARVSAAQSQLVLPGTALPIETATIYARTSGFVREFKVDLGDRVKAGDILAVLDTPEVQSDARSASARAEESALNEKISRATAERYKRLADAGVSSREQAEQALAQANSAEAALRTSNAEVTRTKTLLDFRIVRAPFDGVITKRNVEKGSLVTAGSGAGVSSLFEIVRPETLKIWVDVPQGLASEVRVGGDARVLSGRLVVPGKVARTSGTLDPTTRTLRAEIHVPGDQGVLAGSFVKVSFDIHSDHPPVVVPANAVSPRPDGMFVFTADAGNKVHLVPIVLGRELGATVEVQSGLEGKEKVVTNPPENLADGELVSLVAPPPPAASATPPAASSAPPSAAAKGATNAAR